MSLSRLGRWLRRALVALVLATFGWFGWGSFQAIQFHDTLGDLQRSGAIRPLEALRVPPGPEAENGYPLLRDAQADSHMTRLDLMSDAREAGLATGGPDVSASWTDEQRAVARGILGAQREWTDVIDIALARPRIVAFSETDPEICAPMEASWVLRVFQETAAAWPDRRPAQVDRMLRFLARWRTQPGMAFTRPALWQAMVFPEISHLLATAMLDPARVAAWQARLAEEEARLLAVPGTVEAHTRAFLLHLLSRWQRGEDPMAGLRDTIGSLGGTLDELSDRDLAEEARQQIGPALQTLLGGILQPPPHQAWWAWPLLQNTCRKLGEELQAWTVQPWTLRRMLEIASGDADPAPQADTAQTVQVVIQRMADLRAVRAALAIRAAWRTGPADLAALRQAVEVRDLLSGAPFLITEEDGLVVVSFPPSPLRDALDRALGENPHASWRVTAP